MGGRPIGADRDAYHASFSYWRTTTDSSPIDRARDLAFEVACAAGSVDRTDDAIAHVGLAASRDQAAAVLSAGSAGGLRWRASC